MASNINNIHPQLPKLNGRNYYHWSIQLKVLFESLDLWDIIEDGLEDPDDEDELTDEQMEEIKNSKRRDKKALFLIFQAVDETIFERISSSTSSKNAWDTLHKTYRGEERVKIVRLQTLRCEFDNIRMKETESVEEYYNRVILLLNQLRLNGEHIDNTRVVEKILRSLTRKFEYVVVAIEESKDLSLLSLENLLGTLQSHELRMNQFDSPAIEQAFQLQSSNQGGFYNNHRDPVQEQSKSKGHGKSSSSQLQCYYCQKMGHAIKYCRKRLADEKKGSTFIHKEDSDEGDTMFMMLST